MWNEESLEHINLLGANLQNILVSFGGLTLLASQILLDEKLGSDDGTGMIQIDPQGWYPIIPVLRAFRRIGKEYGDFTLQQVGLNVPKVAPFPSDIVNIESALQSIDVAYHMNHGTHGEPLYSVATGQMKEGIGHYNYKRVPEQKQILIESSSPYPCAFDVGVVLAMAQRFEPSAVVTHSSTSCRKRGLQSCTYIVNWL